MNYRAYKKLLLTCSIIYLITHSLYSQDEGDNWVAGIGINVVDIRTPSGITGILKDYANASFEDLNMNGGFVRVFAGKYLSKGMTLQLSASANKIKKGFGYSNEQDLINDSFFAVDMKLKYDINRLIGETAWFDPFTYGWWLFKN